MSDSGIKVLKFDESGNPVTRSLLSEELLELQKSVQANVEASVDAPYEDSGDNWVGYIYGHCPVQGEGTITVNDQTLTWYFRARHDNWSFEVDENNDQSSHYVFYKGEYHNASWMKYSHAWQIIQSCIDKYQTKAT